MLPHHAARVGVCLSITPFMSPSPQASKRSQVEQLLYELVDERGRRERSGGSSGCRSKSGRSKGGRGKEAPGMSARAVLNLMENRGLLE